MDAKVMVSIEYLETAIRDTTLQSTGRNEGKVVVKERRTKVECIQQELQHGIGKDSNDCMQNHSPRMRRYSDIPLHREATCKPSKKSAAAARKNHERDEYNLAENALARDENVQYLIKPMSNLQVCPADDMALEEDKRRRRYHHSKRSDNVVRSWNMCAASNQMKRVPALGRDGWAIRHQYWKQLGICPSRQELERVIKGPVQKKQGLKVLLNDVNKSSSGKSLMQVLLKWCNPNDKSNKNNKKNETVSSNDHETPPLSSTIDKLNLSPASTDAVCDTSSNSSSVAIVGPLSRCKSSVRFDDEAELFYIPIHKEYSKRQRDSMWHTREEFISMVERNLEAVFEELEDVFEEQVECSSEDSDRTESRQSKEENDSVFNDSNVKHRSIGNAISVADQLTPDKSVKSSLALCFNEIQVQVNARARSSHQIRFKYLKHLGIDS